MIETDRLVLRPTEERDRPALLAQCRDPEVMAFLLPIADEAAFDAMIERMTGYQRDYGYSFWTAERRGDGQVMGVCGLKPGALETPIAGQVEIGWRFARAHWGQGYAGESARACIDWAWAQLDTDSIAAITASGNAASWRLMQRLGMARDPAADFEHPAVPDGSLLRPHITYRIARPAVRQLRG